MSDKAPFNPKKILDDFQKDPLKAGAELRVDKDAMSKEDFDNTVKIINMGLEEKKQKVVVEKDQIVLEDPWSGLMGKKVLTKDSDKGDQKAGTGAALRNVAYNKAMIEIAGQ